MTNSNLKRPLFLVFVFALLIPLVTPLLVSVSATSLTFTRAPLSYDMQTGAFTMGSQLTNDGEINGGGVCVMFDYFIFNAQAGQTLQAQVESAGKKVSYMILNSPSGLYRFQNSNCGYGNWGPVEGFTAQTTINWLAPANGQYVLIFLTNGFYSGKVFFTPQ